MKSLDDINRTLTIKFQTSGRGGDGDELAAETMVPLDGVHPEQGEKKGRASRRTEGSPKV